LATQRIYIVGTPTGETRLVRASIKQQALHHVANSVFVVRVASQDELVQAISKGVTVENYKAPDQAELDLA
jgi:CRISPR/Cas system-associated endoribonuclease Cas2